MKHNFGPAVIDGRLNYTSPSAMATASPSEDGGCLRKWWFRYVLGIRGPESVAQRTGKEAHDQIERYLTTGQDVLGTHARKARRWIPEPGQDLAVEIGTAPSEFLIAGTQVNMRLDLAHARGYYHAADDFGTLEQDNGNVVEVIDWKFTGNMNYVKQPKTLAMIMYGKWVLEKFDPTAVRLSLVYSHTKSRRAQKTTTLMQAEQIEERFQKLLPIISQIRDAACEKEVDSVPANVGACDSYGGCDFRKNGMCTAGAQKTLIDIFGAAGAAKLTEGARDMSILDGAVNPAVAAEMVKLEAVERAAVVDPLERVVKAIDKANLGFPQCGGEAASAVARVRGLELKGAGLAATPGPEGADLDLSKLAFDTPTQLIGLADELVNAELTSYDEPGSGALVPPGGLMTEPPATEPITFPKTVEAMGGPPAAPTEPPAAEPAAPTQPPAAPTAEPAAPTEPPAPTPAPTAKEIANQAPLHESDPISIALAVLSKPKCGAKERRKAVESLRAALDTEALPAVSGEMVALSQEIAQLRQANQDLRDHITSQPNTQEVTVYVNCVRPPADAKPLDEYIDRQRAALREAADVTDIRFAPKDNVLGYRVWPGAIAALVRENMPEGGSYYVDIVGFGREVAAQVVDTLREMKAKIVRGTL